ncbi:uncharacterized protein LOC132061272 [Lycium ferocissimum]|uniref:uncharacterized protein LOC132061272 n=1 Tax=Lycium ferocissimum TaxID=112874 RepID=UPI00281627C8|nr:uncharacterized protein LOC132061272 [Lycium ferocissimum]
MVADDIAFEKDNKTVRGHLLNHMTNPLFDLFVTNKSAKEVWDSLEKKYGADDAGKKKYIIGQWIKFQIVDNKPIMEQVHEYENLTADELISHMRTEEANRLKDEMEALSLNSPKINLAKISGTVVKDRASQCNQRQGQNSKQGGQGASQANLGEGNDVITIVVAEANLVVNKTDWVFGHGASRHLSANKELFNNFEESTDGEYVYMGNSTTAGVMCYIPCFEQWDNMSELR